MVVNDAQTTQYDNKDVLLQKYKQCENIFEEGDRSCEGQIENDVFGDIKLEIKEEAIVDDDEAIRILENCDERSTACVEKNRKLLGTSEELRISVKRENLYELQKLYKGKQFVQSKFRKPSIPKKRFFCKSCLFIANRKFDLFTHIVGIHKRLAAKMEIPPLKNMFPGENPNIVWYRCTDCTYVTKMKHRIHVHIVTHKQLHEVETFRCASCPYITKAKINLINHMDSHKQEMEKIMHSCPYCNFSSLDKRYMKKHIILLHKAHEAEIFKCNKCKFKTVYKLTLRNHLLIHNESRKLYKCKLCDFQTPHKSVLRDSHRLSHKNEESRIFGCAHCSYKAKNKDTLKRHLQGHRPPEEVLMYNCDKCSYQTRHKRGVYRHQQVHKAPEELILAPCSLCPYKGRTKDHLRQHLNTRHNPNPTVYCCKECSYQSKDRGMMKRHSFIHMDDKDINFHHCDFCNYKAKSRNEVTSHFKRIHVPKPKEIIKWHVCDQCGLQFRQKWHLKRHMRSHEDPGRTTSIDPKEAKKFNCYHCSYSTKKRDYLESHMPMHKNVFIHCDKCDFQTRYKSCITRHRKTQH